MAYDVNIEASNTADFVLDVSATDQDTGLAIDFTGAQATFQIVDDQDSVLLTAAVSNGGITMAVGTTMEISFTAAQMAALQKGNYRIGMVYQLNGQTNQLFKGQISVYDGIATLQ